MKGNKEVSSKSQIVTLLSVIAAGVAVAFAAALIMLMGHQAPKSYLLKNALLSPQVAISLVKEPLIFDHIELSVWSPKDQKWIKQNVDPEHGQKFYSQLADDQNLQTTSSEVMDSFGSRPTSLVYLFRSKSNSAESIQPFQVVEFAEHGDYYRVELPTDTRDKSAKWLYFFHPSIHDLLAQLMHAKDGGQK